MKFDLQKLVKNICVFLVVYAVIFGFFLLVSVGIGTSGFYLHMRRFILAALVALLPYYFLPKFNIKFCLPELFIALLWMVTSPLICYLRVKAVGGSISMPYDVAIGAYLFCALCGVKYLVGLCKHNKFGGVIYSLLQSALAIIPVFHIVYFSIFKNPLGSNGTMVIYQTNISEALEYLSSMGVMQWSLIICFLLAFVLLIKYNNVILSMELNWNISRKKIIALCVVSAITGYYAIFSLLPRTHVVSLMNATKQYFDAVKEYKGHHDKIFEALEVKNDNPDDKGTIILIIGESATRNYMKAFNNSNDETTPWLSRVKNNDDFYLFKNSYACAWNTVPALEHALTEANYYNNKEFNKSASIVDIAKKSGYNTYWFSNQGKIGIYDTPITLVAETSDVVKFGGSSVYDEGLLQHLKNIDKQKNNFIVLHIMGSHIDYNNRYPKEYQIWNDPDHSGRVADYKNSLVYTDHFLQEVFEYSRQNLNLKAMVYFSDHGTDPNRTRDPDETRFIGLRIPLVVYLSSDYKNQHSAAVNA